MSGSDDSIFNVVSEQSQAPPNYSRKSENSPTRDTYAVEDKSIASEVMPGDRNLHHRGPTISSDGGSQQVEKTTMISVIIEEDQKKSKMKNLLTKARPAIHLLVFLLFTGWLIAGLALHSKDLGWLVPFLVWFAVTVRLITFYLPISIVMKPLETAWNLSFHRGTMMIPEKMRLPLAATATILIITIGAFASPESLDNTRANRAISLFGLIVFLAGLWATSRNRAAIQWRTVIVGMLMQFVIALFVLRTSAGCKLKLPSSSRADFDSRYIQLYQSSSSVSTWLCRLRPHLPDR